MPSDPTPFAGDAERIANEIDEFLKSHPRDTVTVAEAKLLASKVRHFGEAARRAAQNLRRQESYYVDVARHARDTAIHNEETKRGKPIGFLGRRFL